MRIWKIFVSRLDIFAIHLSLKTRVYLVNAILLTVTVIGAVLMIWYTYKIEKVFNQIIHKNMVILRSTEALERSLIDQKGFVSYYFLDNDLEWLSRLDHYRSIFNKNLEILRHLIEDQWDKETLARIEKDYRFYVSERDRVIGLYRSGDKEQGMALHKDVRKAFFHIRELFEELNTRHAKTIETAVEKSGGEANNLRLIALMAIVSVTLLSLLVNFIFARHIMGPIRKLILQVDNRDGLKKSLDEVGTLQKGVQGLIEDAEVTQLKLKQSQESLMQSEKMALIGKLAAGTAHSIRNPLTSVKMRLFSLNRSCSFSDAQKEDFNVISGEITQINRIVENFLEFSRPPKLTIRKMSPSLVVDSAVYLLDQRLKSYQVDLKIFRNGFLAETLIDPDQLKEVIVNIMINACEAMKNGGTITIREEETKGGESAGKYDSIRISDDGQGIAENIKNKIFDPFFTTKEQGTGLGLSIAFNIIHEHGGRLSVTSDEGMGTCFVINLPVKDE
jgi:signal transduction histidine kinase